MLVSESLQAFTRARQTPANADLIDRQDIGMETQINVATGDGEPVAGKKGTFSNGVDTWYHIRIPRGANSTPVWRDYPIPFILDEHAEGIALSGWNWQTRCSKWVGIEFDAVEGHADGVGISAEDLQLVCDALGKLLYVQTRRSTGGRGIHCYTYVDDIPTENHTVHSALAKAILAKMSKDTGIDLESKVDAVGGLMWIWHVKMTPENHGLEIIHPASQILTEDDLPGWRDSLPKKDIPPATTTPPAKADPVEDDFKRNGDWLFLREFGTTVNDTTFLRLGSDKEKSGVFLASKDGVPLMYVHSTGMQPFESGKAYNRFTVYSVLKHGGDRQAARADLKRQGYGCEGTGCKTAAEWLDTGMQKEYHVEGVMVAGLNMFIAGEEKTGKTSTTIDLAVSLATATPFLGRFRVSKSVPVLMLSGESGMQTIIETFDRICKSKELDPRSVANVWFSPWTPRLDNEENINRIARDIRRLKPAVLIIDPLYYCVSSSIDGSIAGVGEATRRIADLCQEYGVSLVLLAHTRKRSKGDSTYGPKLLSDIAGAGWGAMARQWLIITRREPYVPGTGKHRLLIDIGASAGQSSRWALDIDEGTDCDNRQWVLTTSTADEAVENKKELAFAGQVTMARHKILDALKLFPGGETQRQILTAASLNNGKASLLALAELKNELLIVPCDVRKNTTTYQGYRLADKGAA